MNRVFQFSALIVVLILTGFPAVCQVITPTPNPNAWRVDLNSDGQINAQDFFLFRELWHTQNIVTPTPTGTPTSTFTATRTPTQEEISPYVSSTPPRFALVGELLLYPIVAVDPNGDSITFAPVTVPAGMTVSATGLVKWTPAVPGKVDISIGLTDGKNPQVLHEFTLHVGVAGTEASGVVTSTGGGTVEVNDPNSPIDGTRVEVPPGGLTEDATVTIRSVSNPEEFFAGALPVELLGLGSTQTGITVEVPYGDDLLSTFGITAEDLRVYFLDPATGEWIELPAVHGKRRKDNPPGGFMVVQLPPFTSPPPDMRIANSTPQVIISTNRLYRLKQQPQELMPIKGSVDDFFAASAPKKRLLFLHGIISSPDEFMGKNDFFAQEPSPFNTVSPVLFSSYDSIIAYQYRSGNAIAINANFLAAEIKRRYYNGTVYQPDVLGPGIALYRIDHDPNFKFDILSHSMGGLVARYMLEKATLDAGAKLSGNLGRLITLGTPHGGADNENRVIKYVFGPAATGLGSLASLPGLVDLVAGSAFLRSLNENQLNADTFTPSGSYRYYSIAGLIDSGLTPNSDGWVTKPSALFLNLPLTREKTFGPDGDRYTHSNLHELAATNGVGQQVLTWLLTTPTPTRTPTATPIPYTGEHVVVDLPDWPYPDPPEGPRKLEFVRIPAGSFMMGSESERGGSGSEAPRHEVFIEEDFYLGVTEVTQLQWRAIWGSNPANSYGVGDDYPVYHVSWNDIQTYLFWLNGLGIGTFRLPSEAEWEYACRAGTTSPPYRFSFGPNLFCTDDCAFCPLADQFMWWCGNAGGQTHEVALKSPNQWGLFDMHGNVWEWVQDEWHGNYAGAPEDGSAWETVGSYGNRVVRGGSWDDDSNSCRSAARGNNLPHSRGPYVGLRLVLVP